MAFLKHSETSPLLAAEKQLEMLQLKQPAEPWFAYFIGTEKSVRSLISGQLDTHKGALPATFYCTAEQAVLSVSKTAPGNGYILVFGCDKLTIKDLTNRGEFHKSILYAFSAHEFKHNQMYPNQKKAITVIENTDLCQNPSSESDDTQSLEL